MEKTIIGVDGMACEHCVKAVTTAVSALPGVSSVTVDLAAKTVTIQHDPEVAPLEKIKLTIEDQGYDIMS